MIDLSGFNEKQKEAVLYNDGPLLILAGAGSGKTKVLTTKVAKLVSDGVDVSEILAITFTNKASREMKERIINLIGKRAFYIQISTFHSFGLKILKENYKQLNYEKNFTILDSDDTLSLIKKILKEQKLDKANDAKYIRNEISKAKNDLIDEEEYSKRVTDDEEIVIEKVYKIYQKKLKQNNSVDFDDLLLLPIKLFVNYPDILKCYQERYKYILIDEYQDTNQAQYILTKMISAKYKNICVVGDNDQSIYSFRGANYKNILNFENDYKNAKVIMLEQNYRSTKNILSAANSVIKNNVNRKEKKLWSENDEGSKIIYHRAFNEKEEASYIVNEIQKLLDAGESENEMAVIYRTNAQSRAIEEAFLKSNIKYKVIGSFYFYSRREIKDLISYLKVVYNTNDDINLTRVINVPRRGIGEKTITSLINRANDNGISMYDAITFGSKEYQFKKTIEEIKRESVNKTLTELIDIVLDKSGMLKALEAEKTFEADTRIENLEEFKSITKNFEEEQGIVSLEDFLNEITLVSDVEEHKDDDNKVILMTMHASKGLEFNEVFISGFEEKIFPSERSCYRQEDIEEERRLCYVAITRAKKKLYIINAMKRRLYGLDNYNRPSRFLDEIDENYIERDHGDLNNIYNNRNDEEIYNTKFNVGDKVKQDKYGEGIVVAKDKNFIDIAFSYPIGIKKFINGHKSIKHIENDEIKQ